MECPDPEALTALVLGDRLSDAERSALIAHTSGCPACSAALKAMVDDPDEPPAAEEAPARAPEAIGRYVIDSTLGAGGMGVVYKARDPELDRVVAIKILRPGTDAARLKREAQALAKLDHPNVVAVYDVGTQGQMFIAMAYVDGDNLREWLKRKDEPRTPGQILDALVDAGRGVAAAHSVGLIHRDLKPDNIFVSRAGRVLVGDFGLVRISDAPEGAASGRAGGAVTADGNLTRGWVAGTPAYMAPEQAEGAATAASDQFSFCVTAWEALTGHRPFEGRKLEELLDSARASAIARPAGARSMPRRIEAALRRGLSPDPAQRFGSMDELLRVLDRRRRVRWGIASASLGIAAIGAAIAVTQWPRGPAPPALLPCGDDEALMAEVWNPGRRAELERALASATAAPPLVKHILDGLDATSRKWVETRRSACEAQRDRGRESFERRVDCFDRIRHMLGVVSLMLPEVEELGIQTAIYVERAFPIERCTGAVPPARPAPPAAAQQQEVDRVRATVVRIGMRSSHGDEHRELQDLFERADGIGYRPLIAEVAAVQAEHAYRFDRYAAAEQAARGALRIAEQENDDRARAEAAAMLVRSLTRQGQAAAANEQLGSAETAWQRAGKDPHVEIAILIARADLSRFMNSRDQIARHEELAERARKVYGEQSLYLATVLTELADMYPPEEQAKTPRVVAEANAIWSAAAGGAAALPSAVAEVDAAVGDLPRKIDAQRRLIAAFRQVDPGSDDEVYAWSILAVYLEMATRWPEAIAAYRRGLELHAKLQPPILQLHFDLLYGLGGVLLEGGEAREAVRTLLAVRALMTDKFPTADERSGLDAVLGRAHEALREHEDAIRLLAPLAESLRGANPPRWTRLALVCASLARALFQQGGQRVRARELAQDAKIAFTRAIEEMAQDPMKAAVIEHMRRSLAQLETWISQHKD